MNPVGELLQAGDIHLDVDVPDSERLLAMVSALLARRSGLSAASVLQSLKAREALGSTGLGRGVAIPHARMAQCTGAAGVFVRTRTAVTFDAPDRQPVSIFLALIVPREATERHLKLLATAATMFSERAFREKLKACEDPGVARELLAAWPDPPTAGGESHPPTG